MQLKELFLSWLVSAIQMLTANPAHNHNMKQNIFPNILLS